ncbi:DUF4870 domain-containing protein [Nonomuraea longicatena]|uniref:DUF4870 domain-containing protein n=1 Tax=Nonomuraea longicatena TaxID=83682 RepID=A0ABP4A3M8_9ACTN
MSHPQPPHDATGGVPPQYPYGQLPSGPYETYPYGPGAYPPPPAHGRPMPFHDGPRPGTDDTTLAMLAHLLGLVSGWVGPLVIYLTKKDESPYIRRQAAEALNFQLTMFIAYLVAVLLSIVLIGLLLLPIVFVFSLVFHIQAAVAANRGAAYRYPVSIRMIT